MTLLQLTPEGERLRRIAKAHAAGELSTADYRRIRSDVIERFAAFDGDITGDDTQQRWVERTPLSAAESAETAADLRRARRPARVVWLMGAGLLLIVLLASGIY
jgi:hypothetical protein